MTLAGSARQAGRMTTMTFGPNFKIGDTDITDCVETANVEMNGEAVGVTLLLKNVSVTRTSNGDIQIGFGE